MPVCDDPLVITSQDSTCTPWVDAWGWYYGDGTSEALYLDVHTALDDDSVLGNYALVRSAFYHAYPNADQLYTAFFTGRGQPEDFMNNPQVLFRVETTIDLTMRNKSPVIRPHPVIPVVMSTSSTDTTITFTVPAFDPDGDNLVWAFGTVRP